MKFVVFINYICHEQPLVAHGLECILFIYIFNDFKFIFTEFHISNTNQSPSVSVYIGFLAFNTTPCHVMMNQHSFNY